MSRSNGIVLLLGCFLLLTMMGLAHAQESSLTISTDKTTYTAGGIVYVTVEIASWKISYGQSVTVEIVHAPITLDELSSPTVEGTVSLTWTGNENVPYGGTVALVLPANAPPGVYDVGVYWGPYGSSTLDPAVGITVTL
jgi:hypothetical protein